MMYDAVWTLGKAIDELGTMRPVNVERVNCEQGRDANSPGKKTADEVLKQVLEVSGNLA